jgi:ComF family protein
MEFTNYQKAKEFILDLLFPKRCVGCGEEGQWLCKQCQKEIILVASPCCPRCNRLTSKGQFCSTCRPHTFLTGVLVAAWYDQGPLKEVIHSYKYDYIGDLHKLLSPLLVSCLLKNPMPQNSLIIPVPLHRRREARRGFNQSELLARDISLALGLQSSRQVLIRKKDTIPQIELSGDKRKKNVQGVFQCINPEIVQGRTIIIVDDVATTCATLEECAKVLRGAGARQVWGLVVARHL